MSRARRGPVQADLSGWTSRLGARLREIRASRGESLTTVGKATGISTSFLSLLEQGRTDVSLGRLLPLVDYYGLSLAELLATEASIGDTVVRSADRQPLFSVAQGIDVYLAAPDQKRPFTPLVVEYAAGAAMDSWSEHDGEEFVFVLAGALRIEFRTSDELTLDTGDSVFFNSRRPHKIVAAGDLRARALIVTTERDPR